MSHALSLKYRPRCMPEIVGQPEAVKIIQQKIDRNKIPHVCLFSGPSGCGKTTMVRIISKALGCKKGDYCELNSANFRGIETARGMTRAAHRQPLYGPCRVWCIDEAHQLTKDAQEAILKLLEDTPEKAYFFLCTTEPQKLLKAIQTRSFHIPVKHVGNKDLTARLLYITGKENVEVSEDVLEKIVEHSEGSVRMAERLLEKVIDLEDSKDQLQAIQSISVKREAIEIARALVQPRPKWSQIAKILKEVEEEPEGLRRLILGYCRSILLGGGKLAPRANNIIKIFQYNLYDSGAPGFASMCWDACFCK